MKALFENLLYLIRKKSPKELKKILNSTKKPDKVIICIKNTNDNSIGYYTIDTKVPILYLDTEISNKCNSILSPYLSIKELTKLLDEDSIRIEDITTNEKK